MNRTLGSRVGFAVAAGFVSLTGQVWAFRSGPPAAHNGSVDSMGNTCTACHLGGAGSGMVEILGAPSSYEANETYSLTVRISDPVQAGAGFQISVEDAGGTHVGTLIVTDATNTQINIGDSGYVNHTSTGVSNSVTNWVAMGDSAEYNLDWQAPASDAGTVTFWAVGNAINNNFSNSGDLVYLTNTSADFDAGVMVPATSTWGLLLLTLVMLIAGSVVIARKAVPAAIRA